jgi:hypothetical protein
MAPLSTIFQLYRGGQVEETVVPGEYHRLTILYHNFVSSTPRLNGIRTHNVSGDRH